MPTFHRRSVTSKGNLFLVWFSKVFIFWSAIYVYWFKSYLINIYKIAWMMYLCKVVATAQDPSPGLLAPAAPTAGKSQEGPATIASPVWDPELANLPDIVCTVFWVKNNAWQLYYFYVTMQLMIYELCNFPITPKGISMAEQFMFPIWLIFRTLKLKLKIIFIYFCWGQLCMFWEWRWSGVEFIVVLESVRPTAAWS